MTKEERKRYVLAQLNSLPNAFQYIEVTNYIDLLEQGNQQLKVQLEFERQCQNRFFKVNNKTYDGRIVLEKLKQRDEVIDEAIKELADSKEYQISIAMELNNKQSILVKLLEILQKYKGDNNE